MDDDVKSALDARRNLGSAIRGFRQELGWSTQDLADQLGYSRSTVSRSETGEKSITVEQLNQIISALQVDRESAGALHVLLEKTNEEQWWDDEYFGFLTPNMRKNAGYEAAARTFLILEETSVPGLFQSDKFVDPLMEQTFGPDSRLYEKRTTYRLGRRRYLDPERGVTFHVILDEAVLLRCMSNPEVGRDQIQYLLDLGDQDNVTIQIVPLSFLRSTVMGSRVLMEFGHEIKPVVFSETSLISKFSEHPNDVAETRNLFAEHLRQALSAEDTRKLLASLLS